MRRALASRVVGRRVVSARLYRRDVLVMPGDPAGGFARNPGSAPARRRVPPSALLVEGVLTTPARRGKQLALCAADGRTVLVHLGMTGSVLVLEKGSRGPQDHVHASWRLDDGSRVLFRDPRRFGGLWALASAADLDRRWASLGPDGLEVSGDQLFQALRRTRRGLKAALLDQHVVAGVGNIYADEALHRAGLHPRRRGESLSVAEAHRLAEEARRVLAEAVEARGSTLRDYRLPGGEAGGFAARHRVYGRGGQPCLACGGPLLHAVVAQRTTVWCPKCQPEGAAE